MSILGRAYHCEATLTNIEESADTCRLSFICQPMHWALDALKTNNAALHRWQPPGMKKKPSHPNLYPKCTHPRLNSWNPTCPQPVCLRNIEKQQQFSWNNVHVPRNKQSPLCCHMSTNTCKRSKIDGLIWIDNDWCVYIHIISVAPLVELLI